MEGGGEITPPLLPTPPLSPISSPAGYFSCHTGDDSRSPIFFFLFFSLPLIMELHAHTHTARRGKRHSSNRRKQKNCFCMQPRLVCSESRSLLLLSGGGGVRRISFRQRRQKRNSVCIPVLHKKPSPKPASNFSTLFWPSNGIICIVR